MFELPESLIRTVPEYRLRGVVPPWRDVLRATPRLDAATGKIEQRQDVAYYKVADVGSSTVGDRVYALQLTCRSGATAVFLTYGASVAWLSDTDTLEQGTSYVLSYETVDEYLESDAYLGASVGRVCNRVSPIHVQDSHSAFLLHPNHRAGHVAHHGGQAGWSMRLWNIETIEADASNDQLMLKMSYLSPHGEQGYNGSVRCEAVYTLKACGDKSLRLSVEYQTTALNAPTHVNVTCHPYFNLERAQSSVLDSHFVAQLPCANHVMEVDGAQIPSGKMLPTAGTPLELQQGVILSESAPRDGYDSFYVFSTTCALEEGCSRNRVMSLGSTNGTRLTVSSNQPGFQFYTGNFLGNRGMLVRHQGVCVEPSLLLNAATWESPPSTLLPIGETLIQTIHYELAW
ncbi:Aldose 1-epimerase [Porphyridium purpureum]|uniref:Aldose 1-epimerase n=1 Tax=Porphyridium purpureum TaxID=35688 RepID=A0A5J4Z4E4_PORPP|nr:Aldose 1-epimerase [Porphyridium purpureum]|eukprot:POR6758..scf295_1